MGLIPGLGRCPGEWNGDPLQYSCLENFTDRRAWWAIVHGAAKSQAQLSMRMMHCIPTEDNYLLHHFIWIKPGVAAATVAKVASVVSDSVQPHRWQPTRLPRPWDSPCKNTGVGWHFLLQCMKVKNESEVAQLCLTLRDPMDCSLPGSSIHGIFQARVLE